MKKYILGALLFASYYTFASAQVSDVDTSQDASCAIISSNLRYLSRDTTSSNDVSVLQDFLNSRGYLQSQPTGFFGTATRKAVIVFQGDNGLRSSPPGFVGAGTRAKIKALDCNDTTSPGVTTTETTVTTTATTVTLKPSVRVMSPVAGQSLKNGSQQDVGTIVDITWKEENGNYPVAIYLVNKNNQVVRSLTTNTPNTGRYSWKYDPTLYDGTYQIVVELTAIKGDTAVRGYSGYFTLSGSFVTSVLPEITSISPSVVKPGETLYLYGMNQYGHGITVDDTYGFMTSFQSLDGSYSSFIIPETLLPGQHSIRYEQKATGVKTTPFTFEVVAQTSTCPVGTINASGTCVSTTSSALVPTLSAFPTSITSGQSTTLTWGSSGATTCGANSVNGKDLDWMGGSYYAGKTNGNIVITPTVTSTYEVLCRNAVTGKSAKSSITISVIPAQTTTSTSKPVASSAIFDLTQTSPVIKVYGVNLTRATKLEYSANCCKPTSGYLNPSYGNDTAKDFYGDLYLLNTPVLGLQVRTVASDGTAGEWITVQVVQRQATTQTTLANPTLASNSPVSQYVLGGTQFGLATYTLKTAQSGTSATVRELRFTTTGTDTIESVSVGGIPAALVGNKATVTGLNIPITSSGTDVPVTVVYSGFQNSTTGGYLQSSVPGTSLTLSYVEAIVGAVQIITNTTPVSSNQMTLVASKPTVTVGSGSGDNLVLGVENKIGEFTVAADANGKISLSSVSFTVNQTGMSSFQIVSPRIVADGQTIYGSRVSVTGSVVTSDFGYPYEISAGVSKTFTLYGAVNGSIQSGGTPSISSTLTSPSTFMWKDVIGDTAFTADKLPFPINSYKVNITTPPSSVSAPTVTLVAPSYVSFGDVATISWASSGATSCARVGNGDPSWSTGTVSTSGSVSSYPLYATSTTFTISCTGQGGTTVKSATVSTLAGTSMSTTGPMIAGAFTSMACVDIQTNLHRGYESGVVTQLQQFLYTKGILSESPTGFYGDKTVEAVKAYQGNKGLPVTGMVYDFTRQMIKGETCQ